MTNATQTIATQAIAKLAQVHGKGAVKAQVKDFGKVEVKVPTELQADMKWAATRYKGIQKTLASQWNDLVKIGDVILAYRNLYESDKVFGKAIKASPLKAISQQDRNDYMWLASNAERIAKEREAGTITSWSVGVVRKQLRELDKSNAEDSKPKGKTATAKGKGAPTATVAEQRDGMKQPEAKQMREISEADYAKLIVETATKADMDLGELIAQLQKLAK